MQEVDIRQVLDLEFLQEFQDLFAKVMGVAATTTDMSGKAIIKTSNFSDFCMKLTRGTVEGAKRCEACDRDGGISSAKSGRPYVYECHAGLVDFAAPIILEGKQIGTMLGGQVLTSEPDEEKFRRIAEEIGVDPDEYIRALRKIEVVPRERIDAGAQLLYLVSKQVSQASYQEQELKKMLDLLQDSLTQISDNMEELTNSANVVMDNQSNLNKEIQNVEKMSEEINGVVEFIKEIANETKLLSLNASIEAARAGTAGLGFNIVAQEMNKLSSNSQQTVSKIGEFLEDIKKSINQTVVMGTDTMENAKQQSDIIDEMRESINKINDMTANIKTEK